MQISTSEEVDFDSRKNYNEVQQQHSSSLAVDHRNLNGVINDYVPAANPDPQPTAPIYPSPPNIKP